MSPELFSLSSYATVVGSAHGSLILEGPSAKIIPARAEEFSWNTEPTLQACG